MGAGILKTYLYRLSRVPSPLYHHITIIYSNTCIKMATFVLVCLVWLEAIYHSCHVKKPEWVPLIFVKIAAFLGMFSDVC